MDYLTRGTNQTKHIQAFACLTTDMVEEARKRHDLWPVASAALGRTMSVTAMMASELKDEKAKIETQIDGKGELGKIIVDAWSNGNVRGCVTNPKVNFVHKETGGMAVGIAVGTNGYLRVIKDLNLKQPWIGTVDLQSGEIGDDFAYYFTTSEQIPSAVGVGVLVGTDQKIISSGGWIVKMMPEVTEEEIKQTEERIKKIPSVSTMLKEGYTPEKMLQQIIPDYEELGKTELRFKCTCSREKCLNVLNLLKLSELEEMIKEDEKCNMHCEFCGSDYSFSKEELEEILKQRKEKENDVKIEDRNS